MTKRFGPALVAGLVTAFLVSSVALGHSRPLRFTVAPGSVQTSAPAQISGWFNGPLRNDPNWTFLKVTDAQGNRVDTGDAALSSDRKQMTATLRPGLPEGRYLVSWRTWDDADNAIFGDCFYFFIGQAAADQAVAENLRMDGGSACQRIDTSAANGTPVPGATPPASSHGAAGGSEGGEADDHDEEDSSDGIPVWALILGVGVGTVIGGIGGRLLGSRS